MEDNTLCKFHLKVTMRSHKQCPSRHESSMPHPSQHHTPPHQCHHHHHHHHQSHINSSALHHFSTVPSILLALLVLLISLVPSPATAQVQTCTNSAGCFPPTGNLALGRTIRVNSTCMQGQLFCTLLTFPSDCTVCSPEDAHSASSLNDNDNSTFWVSEIGMGVQLVTLNLDFEGPVHFQDMTLVWQSVRPIAMTLERSCDYGETWSVYRYYAVNCAESFMVVDTYVAEGIQPFNGTTPVCTSVQTELFSIGFTNAVVSLTLNC